MTEDRKERGNVPNLRFPEFEGEWEEKKLGGFIDVISGIPLQSADISEDDSGIPILRGINITEGFIRHNKDIDRYYPKTINYNIQKYILEEKDLVLGMDGSKVGKNVAAISNVDAGAILIQRVARIKALKNSDIDFIFQIIFSDKFRRYVDVVNTSSGIPHISLQQIKDFVTGFPVIFTEQNKIAKFLSLLDQRISTQNKIIEDLKLLKSTIRNSLFRELRKTNSKTCIVRDVLNYEQPAKYIVESADYHNDSTLIPVLTANKAFVLGYTSENYGIYDKGDCIIFDDFTMDLKYVDFPFKVKSSAIKILTPKSGMNLKYIYEYLSFLNLASSDHKRHYISEVESMSVYIPELDTQNMFSDLFSALDKKIAGESHYQDLLLSQKQYLLCQLFI